MMLVLAAVLALQAAPGSDGADIAVSSDCRVLRSRQEVRCEVEMEVPPPLGPASVQYECLYSAHRLVGRCIPRSDLPRDPAMRARVEELAQTLETTSLFFQMFNMPGGPEMKITARFPVDAGAPPRSDP